MQSRALWLMHNRNWAIDYGRRWRLTFYHVLCSYPIDGILVHSSHPAHRQVHAFAFGSEVQSQS